MLLMGILNVTPDSFYDGGKHIRVSRALAQAGKMVEEGADILDLGGESSRPGAKPVSQGDELRRILPVLRALRKKFPTMPISIDTRKAGVAQAALEEGANILNDISALTHDPGMIAVAMRHKPKVILMHMKGNPRTMQRRARYLDAVGEIKDFLASRMLWMMAQGFPKKNLVVDPGIGFGKTLHHNLKILYNVRKFGSLGVPVLIGASRKSFIGDLLSKGGRPLPAEERLEGSLAVALWCAQEKVSILRVHDVGATRRAIQAFQTLSTGA